MQTLNPSFQRSLECAGQTYRVWSIQALASSYQFELETLPFSLRLLLEAQLRAFGQGLSDLAAIEALIKQLQQPDASQPNVVIPYLPARVLLQDFTGVPVFVDLAAIREAVAEAGGDPSLVNPVVPTDVVVDHSIIVDVAGVPNAFAINTRYEFERNQERYHLLRWAEAAFEHVRVFPPGSGIVHQINLEHLATVVQTQVTATGELMLPDSVCGTDSHTTMINGLGVLGWGVGGIEAEAVMLGYPLMLTLPSVVGVELTGSLRPGVTTTDLVLSLTQRLRQAGVVEQFVEFCGTGVNQLSIAERATIANMAPEYGATCGYFPVDAETIRYLQTTGRSAELIQQVEAYYQFQGLFRQPNTPLPKFAKLIQFDLATVEACVAGPARPQDRLSLRDVPASVVAAAQPKQQPITVELNDQPYSLNHGALLLAAITSCTNTSNPAVMLAAGVLAQQAVERGLRVPSYVKTSLSPGSRVVAAYLQEAGLLPALETLGFQIVGYGCMTCSGSSGPIDPQLSQAVAEHGLIASGVLSGNRNFEGRIHPAIRLNYLASPPLVIAYALAGTMNIDLETEPLGYGSDGQAVYLADIWPSEQAIQTLLANLIKPSMFHKHYQQPVIPAEWQAIAAEKTMFYPWAEQSTYLKRPHYIHGNRNQAPSIIKDARVLALLGDSITTDHISPGGAIDPKGEAGRYLLEQGVAPSDFNAYGARRGNHEVMVRGGFANARLKNQLLAGIEGGFSLHQPSGQQDTIYETAMHYAATNTPLIILAGHEYGSGSSRDWAAKAPKLLGVQAVLAASFERIHRANLVCMGILPLEFMAGQQWQSLGLTGTECYTIYGLDTLVAGGECVVKASDADGNITRWTMRVRIDNPSELQTYYAGGILQQVVQRLALPQAKQVNQQ